MSSKASIASIAFMESNDILSETQPVSNEITYPPVSPPSPSLRLLFSFLPRRNLFFLLFPAVISSIIAGGVAPFMTFVVGQAFNAFAHFPTTPNPPQSAKDELLRAVGIAALELIALAFGAWAMSSITSFLWISIGETNVMGLRKAVYTAISQKDLSWFDVQMGASEEQGESENSVGAGGLMAKFSRETDEVRMATSLASGMLVQYLTTCVTCLILAFMRSWALTLVILSALPVLVIVQAFSQIFAGPLLAHEREQTGVAATLVDRAVAAISTVKAFNATKLEHSRANDIFTSLKDAARPLNVLWGFTSGVSQFVMMAMFVQGFWFGSKLVREGHISAGDVMAVFWACLIASSNLQMCVPQFIVLAKGKIGMVALITLIDNHHNNIRKIVPTKISGGLALYNVTFSYPSRPTVPVLSDVSLFLPAKDTTFIVGSSGSGKSTVSHLLLKMYKHQKGLVNFDEYDVNYLDDEWLRAHVACVGQQGATGVVIFEEKSVFDNIAAALHGHSDRTPTFQEVENASRAALLHDFVRDLPQGYDTLLGGGAGVGLSGGQKQRLSIARALLRNPTVLVLDEATSALDATSRILVFEAIKQWRRNKTTIVITHDLSQIEAQDFVYVLKDGRVVEQGYRCDLEEVVASPFVDEGQGEFRKLMEAQRETGGFLPEKHFDEVERMTPDLDEQLEKEQQSDEEPTTGNPSYTKHQSLLRPMTFGAWMFDVVSDLTGTKPAVAAVEPVSLPVETKFPARLRRPSSTCFAPELQRPVTAYTLSSKRYSLPPTPTSPSFNFPDYQVPTLSDDDDDDYYNDEKYAIEFNKVVAARRQRTRSTATRTRWNAPKDIPLTQVKIAKPKAAKSQPQPTSDLIEEEQEELPRFWWLMRAVFVTMPRKPLLFFGFFICILNGAMTPVFSFLLSRLLFEVSIGSQNVNIINIFGGLVLGAAAFDGLLLGLKYFTMETCGMGWVTQMRHRAFGKILVQDRSWFDKTRHSPARLVQILVKDADDARDLISVVWGQFCVVVAMLGVGLIWAFVQGWQLTLAGFAIAPVFALVMSVQSKLVARCEVRNKRAREEVARGYYETIINIRSIRSMSFDSTFKAQFDASVDESLSTGVKGALVEGCTYGVANGLIYLAEAILFYVGAVLISRGVYTYLQMVEVLNLVVFSVTIGSQLMNFTQKIAKSVQATSDFDKLSRLDTKTQESQGILRPEIEPTIAFEKVSFNYPERPLAPVLKEVNLKIKSGECVAIVGPSGSGKSTVVSLLQRLYEPTSGIVTIGGIDTRLIEVTHLREHVAVVSQQPHLFDASVADNIRYGHPSISDVDIRYAAKAANIHDFIMSLPAGYDTLVGENASLISGGQAQRLQIARALVRPAKILILDECTSSLDPENQANVLETIYSAKQGRTTVMITHHLEAMMMCDRILVVQDGEIVEEGSYDRLMEQKGVFASLARGGEWIS